jgi:multiple sugar transport system permease protein
MRRNSAGRTAVSLIVLIAALILFMFPVVWMILTSFKSQNEYFSYPPVFWPKSFSLRNYFNSMAFPPDGRGGLQGLRDSFIIAASSTLASVLIGSLAAYSISRFKTAGRTSPSGYSPRACSPPWPQPCRSS